VEWAVKGTGKKAARRIPRLEMNYKRSSLQNDTKEEYKELKNNKRRRKELFKRENCSLCDKDHQLQLSIRVEKVFRKGVTQGQKEK